MGKGSLYPFLNEVLSKQMNKIYIIVVKTKEKKFLKLGFTSNSIRQRFKDFPFNYKVIRVVKNKHAKDIERSIHRLLVRQREFFLDKFDGCTECYPMDCLEYIHELINNYCGIKKKKKQVEKNDYILNEVGQIDYMDLSIFKP